MKPPSLAVLGGSLVTTAGSALLVLLGVMWVLLIATSPDRGRSLRCGVAGARMARLAGLLVIITGAGAVTAVTGVLVAGV